MTTSRSNIELDLDKFLVKPLSDFGVLTRDPDNPVNVATILLYNCTELEGLFTVGNQVTYSYKTFTYKADAWADQGAFFFEVSLQEPHNRLLRYAFPFNIWKPSLMAFAIAPQVLFLAGPRIQFEGEALPDDVRATGLEGCCMSVDALQALIEASLQQYGGLLVPIGPQTWAAVHLLYRANALRQAVLNPDPNHVN